MAHRSSWSRTTSGQLQPNDFTEDGQTLIYAARNATGQDYDLYALDLATRTSSELVVDDGVQGSARLSREGSWLVYSSRETERSEIFVQPYPPDGRKWQVTRTGGRDPRWSPDGRRLFFRSLNGRVVLSVSIEQGNDAFVFGTPRKVIEGEYLLGSGSSFDVGPDGRFLLAREAATSTNRLHVVFDWFAELERLVPIQN